MAQNAYDETTKALINSEFEADSKQKGGANTPPFTQKEPLKIYFSSCKTNCGAWFACANIACAACWMIFLLARSVVAAE